MSHNVSDDTSRLQLISQLFRTGSLARHSLIVPVVMRLPIWTWIPCGIVALVYAILPQESADLLAWWRYVLNREDGKAPSRNHVQQDQRVPPDAIEGA